MSLPKTCKGVFLKEAGADWNVQDVEVRPPQEGELVVKVSHSGICSSDHHVQAGHFGPMVSWPITTGHEFIGKIVALGAGTDKKWKEGDVVGGPWEGGHDGTCRQCTKGLYQMCDNGQVHGVTRNGGHAEYVTMRSESAVRIPDGVNLSETAPLLCAGVTVFNSIRHQKVMAGGTVAVQGLGGLGHLAVQYANKMGYTVIAISTSDAKKEFATKLGAHHYINAKAENAAEALQKLGGADLVVSTIPVPDAISPLIGGLAPLGKLLVLSPVGDLPVSTIAMIGKGLSVTSWPSGASRDCEEAIAFANQHGVRCMVEEFPLSKIAEGVKKMNDGTVRFRSVIVMDK